MGRGHVGEGCDRGPEGGSSEGKGLNSLPSLSENLYKKGVAEVI